VQERLQKEGQEVSLETPRSILNPGEAVSGPEMTEDRPSRLIIGAEFAALVALSAVAGWLAPAANWDLGLFFVLLGFSIFSDMTAIETAAHLKISGSFLALVLAIVFLGGVPAALIGVLTMLVGWARWRDEPHDLLNNLVTYATFPLLSGIAFEAATSSAGITASDPTFYLMVFGVFLLALALNFSMVGAYTCYLERSSFLAKARTALIPLLPSELAAALMAVGVAFIYNEIGIAGVGLFGVVLIIFQYLLGALLVSQQRSEDLEARTKQLASLQVGMLSAMLRTLDLRDQMTARHSAAVARYSRAIAERAGFSQSEQELVHIAALLHDIGKFILPDHILKANTKLNDEDWQLIKRHPHQGAKVVSSVDGYGPVAEIILAHHERIDGGGYPRGLKGDEIPIIARIISVADTYDVMTARDSYRAPVSSFEAIQELRRVAGTQLDARFVEVFIELLEGKDISFRHGEDADFEKELSLEARIAITANPRPSRDRFAGTAGV